MHRMAAAIAPVMATQLFTPDLTDLAHGVRSAASFGCTPEELVRLADGRADVLSVALTFAEDYDGAFVHTPRAIVLRRLQAALSSSRDLRD